MAKGIPTKHNAPRRIRKGEPGYGTKSVVVNAKQGD